MGRGILTTHVPGLAGFLPLDSFRFVDTDPQNGHVRVRKGSSEVFSEVAETLGVLPGASNNPSARVAVAVEGPTDIDALISFATVLKSSGDLLGFDETKIFWIIGGGQTLNDWVERRYLDRIKVPQMFLFDSDRTSASLPPPSSEKERRVTEINRRANCQAFLSKKRTIENYVHPDAISRLSNGKISLPANVDLDYADVAETFRLAFDAAKRIHGNKLNFYPDGHNGQNLGISSTKSNCKKIITAYIMRHMTTDEIWDRGRYNQTGSGEANEIIEWLTAIQKHL